MGKQCQTLFLWAPKSLQMVTAAMKLKDAYSLEGKLWPTLDSIFKSRDITLPTKVRLVKAIVFPVVMYGCELDCEESWAPKNWCFWTVVLEKTLASPLDCKEIQPVHSKGHQSWVFIGRTDAEAETPVLWPPHAKSWLIGKDSDAGRDWGQEGKWMTEDEMAGWHYQLNGHEFEWTPGVGDGQGGLACCDSWGHKELDTIERLNWTDFTQIVTLLPCQVLSKHLKLWVSLCPFVSCFFPYQESTNFLAVIKHEAKDHSSPR